VGAPEDICGILVYVVFVSESLLYVVKFLVSPKQAGKKMFMEKI